jgi:hypothetical protein
VTEKENLVETKKGRLHETRDTPLEIREPLLEKRKGHLAEITIKRTLIPNMMIQCPSIRAQATVSPLITIQAQAIVNQATSQGVHIRAQDKKA